MKFLQVDGRKKLVLIRHIKISLPPFLSKGFFFSKYSFTTVSQNGFRETKSIKVIGQQIETGSLNVKIGVNIIVVLT